MAARIGEGFPKINLRVVVAILYDSSVASVNDCAPTKTRTTMRAL